MLPDRFSYFGRMVTILAVIGWVLASLFLSSPARAAGFPQKGKAVQMLVGFAAGGSTDVGARILASGLEKGLGTAVVVLNKPGASSQIAYTALTQARDNEETPFYPGVKTFEAQGYKLYGPPPGGSRLPREPPKRS